MKEKILAALKTRYANLGFGPKALDGVAAIMEKTVADESHIETAVGGVEPLLRVFQSEADRARTEYNALKGRYEELRAKVEASSAAGGEQQENNEPDIRQIIEDTVAARMAPLQQRLSAYEAQEAQQARSAMISRIVEELGISEMRAQEGFAISDQMDEAGIRAYLTKVRQNEVSRGLPGMGTFPLAGDGEASKDQTDAIVAKMNL